MAFIMCSLSFSSPSHQNRPQLWSQNDLKTTQSSKMLNSAVSWWSGGRALSFVQTLLSSSYNSWKYLFAPGTPFPVTNGLIQFWEILAKLVECQKEYSKCLTHFFIKIPCVMPWDSQVMSSLGLGFSEFWNDSRSDPLWILSCSASQHLSQL